jgi:hypothetical protein
MFSMVTRQRRAGMEFTIKILCALFVIYVGAYERFAVLRGSHKFARKFLWTFHMINYF